MICVWLVEAELFLKAEDSLVYFGSRRTDTRYGHSFQGVETPSQCRYVHYYERIKENGGDLPPEKKVHLRKIRMEGVVESDTRWLALPSRRPTKRGEIHAVETRHQRLQHGVRSVLSL